jgi:predicted dehydrogenase
MSPHGRIARIILHTARIEVKRDALELDSASSNRNENLMNNKVRWGVLGVANIAVKQVIPAMQQGHWSQITAIASRDIAKAKRAAQLLGIPKAYGSYEELLADDEIEAIYNPLPIHLHVPWTIKAAEAGKHVLCEKPISLNAREAEMLLAVRDRTDMKIQEAFMVLTHPQWHGVRKLLRSGRIGEVRSVSGYFSYFNRDPKNIRNDPRIGGGALMDIGCYPITLSRFIFEAEPLKVLALIDRDPDMGIDRLSSAVLDFASGQSVFTCSTQLAPYQRMNIFGATGQIEVEIPFNAPIDKPARIVISRYDNPGGQKEITEFPICNQYTIQGDLFSQSVREKTSQPIPLENAVTNISVIDSLFRSAESGHWENL